MNAPLPVLALTGALAIDVADLRVPAHGFEVQLADWRVERGSRVALIGANGSGKSTMLDALLGVRAASHRQGNMLGEDLAAWGRKSCLRRRCGVLLTNASLPGEMYVSEIVAMHRAIYGRANAAVLDALGVPLLAGKRYRKLSRGEHQRVDLMLALAHEPELVFLDEPMTGLDKQYAKALCDTIARLPQSTVLMACHSADELDLCDRVAWVQQGRIRAWDSPQGLREQLLGDHRLQVSLVDAGEVAGFAARLDTECAPLRFLQRGPRQVTAFGGEALAALARTVVDDPRVDGIEFRRTTATDLLYRCALGEANA